MPAPVPWTPQQKAAIETVGTSLLVSAAAGSGKTAVLAERCAYLVCDADPPCDVDQLLVVTFTEAAAAEMKGRIGRALGERHSADPADLRLVEQMAMIDRAQVGTLHGFCARLLRQHFHLVGLDPGFAILDADEASLLRTNVARALFLESYENDESGDFQRFVDGYGDGDDEPLMRKVAATYEMLRSLVEPARWVAEARRRVAEGAAGPLHATDLGRDLAGLLRGKLDDLARRCAEAVAVVKGAEGFGKYLEQLYELQLTLGDWREAFGDRGFDALADAVRAYEIPAKPRVSASLPGREAASAALDAVRGAMKPQGAGQSPAASLYDLALFSSAEWGAGLAGIAPPLNVFLDLVEDFGRRYDRAKREARGIDFSDLEVLALRVLRDPSSPGLAPSAVARAYHRQFQYVLVDEYQDINEVQDAILCLASRECLGPGRAESGGAGDGTGDDSPANLFCVGDVKQSIYRFRLAEPGRFLRRAAEYRAAAAAAHPAAGNSAPGNPSRGAVIDLQANFRSRGPLLEVLNGVFRRLMTAPAADIEYDDSHALRPGLTYPAGGPECFAGAPVELHLLPPPGAAAGAATDESAADGGDGGGGGHEAGEEDDGNDAGDGGLDRTEREAAFIARRIRQMMGLAPGDDGRAAAPMHVLDKSPDGALVPRPLRFRDVVVLLRSMRFKADQFADLLHRNGVPAHRDSGQGYFDSVEVQDVLALLSVLDNGRQDVPLAALLRGPLAALPEPETALARVRLAYRRLPDPPPFHEAVARFPRDHPDDALSPHLDAFRARLQRWRQLARQRPLAELVWTLYEETGYLAWCGGLDDGEQRTANLLYLHERARQFGTFARQGLFRFLKFLDNLRSESDLGSPSVLGEGDDVVRIMSVHRSKGLEFPVVFLPDLGKRINLLDCSGPILVDRHDYVGLSVVDEVRRVRYPSLASVLVQSRLRQRSLAEELRVLYVATTRAREHLVLVGTCGDAAPLEWQTHWARHAGPFPPEAVLAGRCMLDWIGPASAAMNGLAARGGGAEPFRVVRHGPDQVERWLGSDRRRAGRAAVPAGLAAMAPLDPPPPPHAGADEIIARLTRPYAHEPYTRLPAARAAAEGTDFDEPEDEPRPAPRRPRGAAGLGAAGPGAARGPAGGEPRLFVVPPGERHLPTPRFALARAGLSPADAGAAAHLVLQHLDFRRPCTAEDLEEQVAAMVERKMLTAAQADAVARPSIEWFVRSDLGQLVRRNAAVLRREAPFHLAEAPTESSAPPPADLDRVMVRGRIDLLFPHEGGWVVVDYKTDRVSAKQVPARAALYAPQAAIYRRAVEGITGRKVGAVYWVFLGARVVRAVR